MRIRESGRVNRTVSFAARSLGKRPFTPRMKGLRVKKYAVFLAHTSGRIERIKGCRFFDIDAPILADHARNIRPKAQFIRLFRRFDLEPEYRACRVHEGTKREVAFLGMQGAAHFSIPYIEMRRNALQPSARLQRDFTDAETLPDITFALEVTGIDGIAAIKFPQQGASITTARHVATM